MITVIIFIKKLDYCIFSLNSIKFGPQSNLNLDDQSIDNSDYSIKLKLDGDYFIVSNLENCFK